jgi:hypothetical protein
VLARQKGQWHIPLERKEFRMFKFILCAVFLAGSTSFAADCSGFIVMGPPNAVRNLPVQLTKKQDEKAPEIFHFTQGQDPLLTAETLRTMVDINIATRTIQVLIAKQGGAAVATQGGFDSNGVFVSEVQYAPFSKFQLTCLL